MITIIIIIIIIIVNHYHMSQVAHQAGLILVSVA